MEKLIWDYTFEELLDWARGHTLIEIGKGEYRNAVWLILDQSVRWSRKIADKQHAEEIKKLKKEIHELKTQVKNKDKALGNY